MEGQDNAKVELSAFKRIFANFIYMNSCREPVFGWWMVPVATAEAAVLAIPLILCLPFFILLALFSACNDSIITANCVEPYAGIKS